MNEVFLYGCDGCNTIKYSQIDSSAIWCTMCHVCRGCEFHKKIVVAQGTNRYKESHFLVGEVEKDDNNEGVKG